ncbi:hypothetical protein B0T16DRAFT_384251 [Cercophora newfieldiana]|uniref:Uncharacterized protein n=1 Tax=Cercophora newfieldiana TaxID=92897 RepID=A0AA39YQC5_9PEZI|nr:hypothetical protein B0T16DRAFT_384251 [Cercophora newfieldiana]
MESTIALLVKFNRPFISGTFGEYVLVHVPSYPPANAEHITAMNIESSVKVPEVRKGDWYMIQEKMTPTVAGVEEDEEEEEEEEEETRKAGAWETKRHLTFCCDSKDGAEADAHNDSAGDNHANNNNGDHLGLNTTISSADVILHGLIHQSSKNLNLRARAAGDVQQSNVADEAREMREMASSRSSLKDTITGTMAPRQMVHGVKTKAKDLSSRAELVRAQKAPHQLCSAGKPPTTFEKRRAANDKRRSKRAAALDIHIPYLNSTREEGMCLAVAYALGGGLRRGRGDGLLREDVERDTAGYLTDPLQCTGDQGRRYYLDYKVDGSHVDAELEARRRHDATQPPALVLDHNALLLTHQSVAGPGEHGFSTKRRGVVRCRTLQSTVHDAPPYPGARSPDRGMFSVNLAAGIEETGSRKVSKLNEEMPVRLPFWKGDRVGRPYELGEAIGGFVREMLALAPKKLADVRPPGTSRPITTLVVERFRDELGGWRAPWALAVSAGIVERYGIDGSVVASDNGIVACILDTEVELPGSELFIFDADGLGRVVTEEQRQRSAQLLDVARNYPEFPILLETARALSQRITSREISIVEVTTDKAPTVRADPALRICRCVPLRGRHTPPAERRASA